MRVKIYKNLNIITLHTYIQYIEQLLNKFNMSKYEEAFTPKECRLNLKLKNSDSPFSISAVNWQPYAPVIVNKPDISNRIGFLS